MKDDFEAKFREACETVGSYWKRLEEEGYTYPTHWPSTYSSEVKYEVEHAGIKLKELEKILKEELGYDVYELPYERVIQIFKDTKYLGNVSQVSVGVMNINDGGTDGDRLRLMELMYMYAATPLSHRRGKVKIKNSRGRYLRGNEDDGFLWSKDGDVYRPEEVYETIIYNTGPDVEIEEVE